jgi:L-alanine-DL-glutamate epimerase-like enolase superfamily enzyme
VKLSDEIRALEHKTNSLQFASGFGIAKRKAAQLAEAREAEIEEGTTALRIGCDTHQREADRLREILEGVTKIAPKYKIVITADGKWNVLPESEAKA